MTSREIDALPGVLCTPPLLELSSLHSHGQIGLGEENQEIDPGEASSTTVVLPSCPSCSATNWERREWHADTTFFYKFDGSIWESSDLDARHVETTFVCLSCDSDLTSEADKNEDDWEFMYEIPCSD